MIDQFTYAVTSLLWTAVGLAFTLHPSAAVLLVAPSYPRLVMVPLSQEVTAMPDKPVQPRRRRPWRPTRGNLVALVLIVLAFATGWQGYRSAQLVECLRGYANQSAEALIARTDASTQQQAALDEVMRAVSKAFTEGPSGSNNVRAELEKYLEKRGQTLAAQEKHPYPDPPRDVCE